MIISIHTKIKRFWIQIFLHKYALCNIKLETCALVQAKVVSEIIRKTLGIRREVMPIRPSSDMLCFKSILLWESIFKTTVGTDNWLESAYPC